MIQIHRLIRPMFCLPLHARGVFIGRRWKQQLPLIVAVQTQFSWFVAFALDDQFMDGFRTLYKSQSSTSSTTAYNKMSQTCRWAAGWNSLSIIMLNIGYSWNSLATIAFIHSFRNITPQSRTHNNVIGFPHSDKKRCTYTRTHIHTHIHTYTFIHCI